MYFFSFSDTLVAFGQPCDATTKICDSNMECDTTCKCADGTTEDGNKCIGTALDQTCPDDTTVCEGIYVCIISEAFSSELLERWKTILIVVGAS